MQHRHCHAYGKQDDANSQGNQPAADLWIHVRYIRLIIAGKPWQSVAIVSFVHFVFNFVEKHRRYHDNDRE
jgi:hypothetical protein